MHDPVTWYEINYTGRQNKGKSIWTGLWYEFPCFGGCVPAYFVPYHVTIAQRTYSESKAIGTRWGSPGACSQARVYAELHVLFNQSSCQTSGSSLHVGILCCFVNYPSRVRLWAKLVYGQMWTYIRTITTSVIQFK